jgi:hypothetical protein
MQGDRHNTHRFVFSHQSLRRKFCTGAPFHFSMALRKARTQNILQEQERLLALADHLLDEPGAENDPEFDASKYDSRPTSSFDLSRIIADNFIKVVAVVVFLLLMLVIGFMEEIGKGDFAGALTKVQANLHKAHAGFTDDSAFHKGIQH